MNRAYEREPHDDPEPEGERASGLCSTCNAAPTCGYRRKDGPPILQCEEFDSSGPPRKEGVILPLARPWEEDQARGDGQAYRGLCVNCGNRRECELIRPEWGVWRCEEYC